MQGGILYLHSFSDWVLTGVACESEVVYLQTCVCCWIMNVAWPLLLLLLLLSIGVVPCRASS
jgi:hypothetical protein